MKQLKQTKNQRICLVDWKGSKNNFTDLLVIAKQNAECNPMVTQSDTDKITWQYIESIVSETKEVSDELRDNNSVYLVDELSDIAWTFAALLEICVNRGLIGSSDDVLKSACKKYTERTPGFLTDSSDVWKEIKLKQKRELESRHKEKYNQFS